MEDLAAIAMLRPVTLRGPSLFVAHHSPLWPALAPESLRNLAQNGRRPTSRMGICIFWLHLAVLRRRNCGRRCVRCPGPAPTGSLAAVVASRGRRDRFPPHSRLRRKSVRSLRHTRNSRCWRDEAARVQGGVVSSLDAAVAAGTTEVAVDCAATPVAADNPFNAIGPPTQLPTPPPQLPAPSAGMIAPVLSAEHVAVAPQCGLLAVSCVLGLGLTAGGAALSGTLIAQQQVAADRDAGIALVVCCGLAGAGGIVAAAHLLARRRFALRL